MTTEDANLIETLTATRDLLATRLAEAEAEWDKTIEFNGQLVARNERLERQLRSTEERRGICRTALSRISAISTEPTVLRITMETFKACDAIVTRENEAILEGAT